MMLKNGLIGEDRIWQPIGFRSLSPFRDKICVLWYTGAYREKLGELDLSVVFPSIASCPTTDYDLQNFLVTIGMSKKPSEEDSQKLTKLLAGWFESVSTQGLFGEGCIKSASREIVFRGRLAQFRVDASNSGQDTLNWLLLSVLNFGYSNIPVQEFVVDHEKKLDLFVGRSRGKTRSIPLQ